jgi:hypothetical protein
VQRFVSRLVGLRLLIFAGAATLAGYVGLFALLESPTLWVYPTLVQDRWPGLFEPILGIFPRAWVEAGRTSDLGLLNSFLYFVLLAWLFGVYVLVLKRVFSSGAFSGADARSALKVILVFTTLSMLVLLFVRGMFSTDIYNYIWYGRIFAIFGGNPYVDLAVSYAPVDAGNWLQYGIYHNNPNAYGPVWVMLAGVIAWVAQVGDGNIVNHLLGHRLLADLAHLVNIWLVWKVARLVIERYWQVPGQAEEAGVEAGRAFARVAVTLAYAWNPLLLIEFGVSGHNDLLLVTCVLAAIWLHLAGNWRLATLALALAGLMKFGAFILVPGYLWLICWQGGTREQDGLISLRQRIWRTGQALLIIAAAYVVCFAPFWRGSATLGGLSILSPGTSSFNHSLGKILVFKLTEGINNVVSGLNGRPPQAYDLDLLREAFDPYVRWLLLSLLAVILVRVTWGARTFGRLLPAWGWVMFVYLTVGVFWFWPWYVSWLVAPVVLVGPGRLWNAVIILCACCMTLYAIFPAGAEPLAPLVGWTGLVNMLPPLAYVLISKKPLLSFWKPQPTVEESK